MQKRMMQIKRIFSIMMIMTMVISSINFSMIEINAVESNDNEVTTTALTYNGYPVQRGFGAIPSQINGNDRKYSVHYYSDGYFMESSSNSSTKYNEHLATMSSALAMAAVCEQDYSDEEKTDPWKSSMAEDILTSSGYEAGYKNGGDNNHETTLNRLTVGKDTVGAVYGYKTVGSGVDECLIVPIVIRDLGLGIEWYGNLDLGTEGDAAGIRKHSNEVKTAVTNYVDALKQKKGINKVKYWVTGFSVGASIADLLAADLTDSYGADNVYSYIFNPIAAASADAEKAASYKNIHYIENYNDYLQYLMPDYMGMRVLGTKHVIADTSNIATFEAEEQAMLEQLDFVKDEKEDCEYLSPSEFQKAILNQDVINMDIGDLLGDIVAKKEIQITSTENQDAGYYQHHIGELLYERVQTAGITRADAFKTSWDSVNGYSFQKSLQTAMMLICDEKYKSVDWKDIGEDIKDNASSLIQLTKIVPFLNKLLKYIKTGKLDSISFSELNTNLWKVLTNWDISLSLFDHGLEIDSIFKKYGISELTNEIKQALPAVMYYAPKFTKQDVQANEQVIASVIENAKRILQAHAPEITHAYMRTEDSYYDAEYMQTLQRYGYQESNIFDKSDSEKIPYMKRNEGYDKAVETSITGINGQSLDGMTIEFNNYNGEQIYKMVISGDSVEKIIWKNNRDRVYFSPTIGPDGKIDELSIFSYDRGYIIDIFTDNDSEDVARSYRVQRKYHDRLTGPVLQKTWDYNKIIEDEVRKLDYIDVDMYKGQQMRIIVCDFAFNDDIKLKNMNRVGKFVSPHLSVIKCGVSADASKFTAESVSGKGRNKYNEIKYKYTGYKSGDTNFKIIDNGIEREATKGERYQAYNYDAKNPNVKLVLEHNAEFHKEIPATCTADGCHAYWYCRACEKYYADNSGEIGAEISASSKIASTGHQWDSGAITKAATQLNAGVKTYTCTTCGQTRTESIPKIGGDLIVGSVKDSTTVTQDFVNEAVTNNRKLIVNFPTGSITFDKAALSAIGNKKFNLSLTPTYSTTDQTKATNIKYTIVLKVDGKTITSLSNATVELKLLNPKGLSAATEKKILRQSGSYYYDTSTVQSGDYSLVNASYLTYYKVLSTSSALTLMKKSIAASTVGTPKLSTKKKTITLSWKDGKGNSPYRYSIYRSLKKTKGYKRVGTLTNSSTSTSNKYTNKGLKKGKKYYYKIVGNVKYNGKVYNTKYTSVKYIKCK